MQPNPYESLQRTLKLFDHFSPERAELTISELALLTGFHKSTVLRLTKMFESAGFLERNRDTLKYRLGLRLHELGSMYLARDLFYAVAAQTLPDLSRRTRHTTYLSVLDGRDLVVIHVSSGLSVLQVVVAPGQRTPAHASAGGKAQLATMTDEQVAALYSGRLQRFTPTTITTIKELLAELKTIRQRGFAVSDREWKEQVCAVGVALPRQRGERGASLAIAFPALSAPPRETIQGIADLLLEKSAEFRRRSPFGASEAAAKSFARPGASPKIGQKRPSDAAGGRAARQRRYGSSSAAGR